MTRPDDTAFVDSIAKLYAREMVPMLFEPYAEDLVRRVARRAPSRVLELAAGTGVVTRMLARALPADVEIVATDLSPAMLEQAASTGTSRPVQWQPADAMRLPFADASFDLIVCQFGVMFFPDKPTAFGQARRVLRPGGHLLFNTWDRIETNEFAAILEHALATVFPDDPPRFISRVPHGYHDRGVITDDLRRGGFANAPAWTTLSARSRADSAHAVAHAFCQGTPVRNEIESRDRSRMAVALDVATRELANRFGQGPIDGAMLAHVLELEREG